MVYTISIYQQAKEDIKHIVEFYNERQLGLGVRFRKELSTTIKVLKINPFFQVRYCEIRLLKIKKFPQLIHFFVDETNHTVIILAVISSHQNPENKWLF